MKLERNSFIDVLRGVISFMVVLGHRGLPGDVGIIADAMGRFGVPIFFMLSGYYAWNEDREVVGKKVKLQILKILRLLILSNIIYIVWGVISSKLYGESAKLWIYDIFTITNILKFFIFNVSKAGIHLWFLGALLYCYYILFYINKKNSYKYMYKSIPILLIINLLVSEVLSGFGILTPVSLTRNFLLFGLPFFALGNFIHKHQKQIIDRLTNVQCISGIIVASLLSCAERVSIARNDMYVGSIISAFLLFMLAIKNPKAGKGSIIEKIGVYYSIPVYIFHLIPLNGVSIMGEYYNFVQNRGFIWAAPVIIWIVTMFGIWIYYKIVIIYQLFSKFNIHKK